MQSPASASIYQVGYYFDLVFDHQVRQTSGSGSGIPRLTKIATFTDLDPRPKHQNSAYASRFALNYAGITGISSPAAFL
jgi:hypothetical protein